MAVPSKEAIVRSYRRLYRHGLRAVQYATPARQTLRKRLQHRYRMGQAADYNEQAIENTIEFLRGAANAKGLEHRIVKRVIFVWWWENIDSRHIQLIKKASPMDRYLRKTALEPFYFTLQMLNDTMGMSLR